MEGFNSVVLVGNIGADPELRYTHGGKAVCDLRMACERPGPEGKTFVSWHSVTVWGKPAEEVARFGKGTGIIVLGREETDSWEKDGEKRYKTFVNAITVGRVCFGPRDEQRDEAPRDQRSAPRGHEQGRTSAPPRDRTPPRNAPAARAPRATF